MSPLPARGAPPALPILQIVGLAYRLVLGQPAAFFAALALPLLIELVLEVGFLSLYGPELVRAMLQPQAADPGMALRSLAVQLCVLMAYALFAVSWHRFTLLGPAERPRVLPPLGGRHLRFAGMTLGVSLLIGIAVGLPVALLLAGQIDSTIALVGLAVIAVALFVRLQLIFPAIALDRQLTLAGAWRLSRGNGLRLFWGFLLAALPWALVSALIDQASEGAQSAFLLTGEPNAGALIAMLVTGLIGYGLIGTLVATLSGAYRALVLDAEEAARARWTPPA